MVKAAGNGYSPHLKLLHRGSTLLLKKSTFSLGIESGTH